MRLALNLVIKLGIHHKRKKERKKKPTKYQHKERNRPGVVKVNRKKIRKKEREKKTYGTNSVSADRP